MSDEDIMEDDAPAKPSGGLLKPLLFGLVGAALLGGGAAYTVSTGLVDIPGVTDAAPKAEATAEKPVEEKPKPAFIELTPLSVAVIVDGRPRQLRLLLNLETEEAAVADIEAVAPRVQDTLNTLLRAIDERDLADPTSLDRLRAQMLRRIRLVADGAAVNDVLIVEYVIL